MSDEKRMFDQVKYVFTDQEIQELGTELAQEVQAVFNLRADKKEKTTTLDAQIRTAEKRVADLTTRINIGSELRDVEVLVLLETPRPGLKRIIRLDTNEPLRDVPMTVEEMQSSLEFGTNTKDDRHDGEDEIDGKSRGAGEK